MSYLARGGFSIVKLGMAKRDNTEVAVKVVKKRKMTKEALEREVFYILILSS